jgi:streptomycin 6-kinase
VDLLPAGLPVLDNLGGIELAAPWLRELPALIAAVRDEYGLTLSAPLHGGSSSWVAPATRPDGTAVIVKISWPHPAMLTEPDVLRAWNGDGAVRLLAHDPARHVMLLQRLDPGVELARSPGRAADRLRIGCAVLRRLWAAPPPPGIERLDGLCAQWAEITEQHMDRIRPGYDPGLVAEGIRLLRELPGSTGREVLLHGDFNPGNVLSHGGGWLAIDPKPLVGDPAYDPWPLLQQIDDPFAYAAPAPQLRSRIALLARELDLDAARIVAWSAARRVEGALDCADGGYIDYGAGLIREARFLLDL